MADAVNNTIGTDAKCHRAALHPVSERVLRIAVPVVMLLLALVIWRPCCGAACPIHPAEIDGLSAVDRLADIAPARHDAITFEALPWRWSAASAAIILVQSADRAGAFCPLCLQVTPVVATRRFDLCPQHADGAADRRLPRGVLPDPFQIGGGRACHNLLLNLTLRHGRWQQLIYLKIPASMYFIRPQDRRWLALIAAVVSNLLPVPPGRVLPASAPESGYAQHPGAAFAALIMPDLHRRRDSASLLHLVAGAVSLMSAAVRGKLMETLRNASVPSALMGRPRRASSVPLDIVIADGRIASITPHQPGPGRDLDCACPVLAFADMPPISTSTSAAPAQSGWHLPWARYGRSPSDRSAMVGCRRRAAWNSRPHRHARYRGAATH